MNRLALPPDEYAALCAYVLRRDKWRCRACGFRNNLHVHHVIFRSQQGPDTPENCVTICNDCHDKIHTHKTLVVVGENADVPGGMKFLRVPKEIAWSPRRLDDHEP